MKALNQMFETGKGREEGGNFFVGAPRSAWSKLLPHPDQYNRVLLPMNALFISTGGTNVLVDPGPGNWPEIASVQGFDLSRILKDVDLSPSNKIDIVIGTSPALERIGALMHKGRSDQIHPRFPDAKVYIPLLSPGHPLEDYQKELGWHVLTEEIRMLDCIDLVPALGGLLLRAVVGGDRLVYYGDLIPTHWHLLNPGWIPSHVLEYNSMASVRKQKTLLLEEALEEGRLVTFSRDPQMKGYVEKKRGGDKNETIEFRAS